jgi:hypothetical protein
LKDNHIARPIASPPAQGVELMSVTYPSKLSKSLPVDTSRIATAKKISSMVPRIPNQVLGAKKPYLRPGDYETRKTRATLTLR